MEKDLDPEIIKRTQIALGKYVRRPPLTEKLLKKPPFRFLHDIVTTVLKTTGFFENLFDDVELISDNVKDRDSKILFLNKVIFVISSTTGKSLSVKPSKIISGQEPEKTNELLQCLAQALDDKLSSEKAVKQYKESLKSTQTTVPKNKESIKPLRTGTDTKKLTSKSTEVLTASKAIKQEKDKSGEVKQRKNDGITRNDVQTKKSQSKATVKNNIIEQRNENVQRRKKKLPNVGEKEQITDVTEKRNLNSQESNVSLEKDSVEETLNVIQVDSPIINEDVQGKLNSSYTIDENVLNSTLSSTDFLESKTIKALENASLKNNHVKEKLADNHQTCADPNDGTTLKSLEIESDIFDNLKSNSEEPQNKIVDIEKTDSYNVAKPPAACENDKKFLRPPSVRPSSSRPGAPRMKEKVDNVIDPDNILIGKVNIIVENTENEEEDDSSLVIIEQAEATAVSKDQQELQLSSNEHGHLVQQILDSQKQLSQISGKTEIEWQFGAQKAREAVNQDIDQLRFSIQALSRVANPFGKLLDHIQEDVEVMRQELQQWSDIYENVNKDMVKQKTLNEDSLMSFHTKLKQLEGYIEEKRDKINDLKITMYKNAKRIEKLLRSGNVQ